MGVKDQIISIRDVLLELESEQKDLQQQLKTLKSNKDNVSGISEQGRLFLDNWKNVAQLCAHGTAQEQQALIRLYIDYIEIGQPDPKVRGGPFKIFFFPEAVEDREDFIRQTVPVNNSEPAEASSLLSDLETVHLDRQKTPPAGLEPAT